MCQVKHTGSSSIERFMYVNFRKNCECAAEVRRSVLRTSSEVLITGVQEVPNRWKTSVRQFAYYTEILQTQFVKDVNISGINVKYVLLFKWP
jgi:hypothetical protein